MKLLTTLITLCLFSFPAFAAEKFECTLNGNMTYGQNQGSYIISKSSAIKGTPITLQLNPAAGAATDKDIIVTYPQSVVLDSSTYDYDESFDHIVSLNYVDSMQKYYMRVSLATDAGNTGVRNRVSSVAVFPKGTDEMEVMITIRPYWFFAHQHTNSSITSNIKCIRK